MAYYVMSDVHGSYDKYIQALDAIALTDDDTLYVLGDIVDRGEHPIKIVRDIMLRHNVVPLLGNHELVAWSILTALTQEITEESIESFDTALLEDIQLWFADGGEPTFNEFMKLSHEDRQEMLAFITEMELYEEVCCGGQEYILVHAGFASFSPDKELHDYSLTDMVLTRTDYDMVYFPDKVLVTGHTPVQRISNGQTDRIIRHNNHIAIDCGCGFGGRLAVLCLNTMQELYF